MSESEPTPEAVVETQTYTNPVYQGYFADPFVWKYQGVYYAIGTGSAEAQGQVEEIGKRRVFPLLRSDDLVNWYFAGNALLRPDPALGDNFWAPEVAYCDGTFYLYYSIGHEDKNHQLRVATSNEPLGPYQDVGEPLLDPASCPFAIDPHPSVMTMDSGTCSMPAISSIATAACVLERH